jgi:uncharacterized protein YbaP (TraB family)
MRIWNKIRAGLATLGLAATAVGVAGPLQARETKPALWQVYDKDTSIYLFGTIHLLPPNTQWRSAKLDQATTGAGTLVVETIIDEKNPQAFAAEFARMGIHPGLPPIVSRVPADKQAALRAVILKSGVPEAALNNMETWAAAFALLQVQFKELGVSGTDGVENTLKQAFTTAGKPIQQLETNSEQLGFFDSLPENAQRELLLGSIEDPAAARQQFNTMFAAWMAGDVKAIGRTFNAEFENSPELKAALLQRRNANWSGWLERRMQQPGTVFVAVGSGHLAGDDSVVEMLKRRGYKVKRVQ